MAEGKNQQRTKLSLDGNVPKSFPNFLRPFDALCDPEGARIVNTATGEATVAGVVGPSPSTLFSAGGSFIALGFFGWFIYLISTAYLWADPPAINELTLDTPKDIEAQFPDLAVVLSLTPRDLYVASHRRQIKANSTYGAKTWWDADEVAKDQWELLSEDQQKLYEPVETRTLEYLWPVFRWESIEGGFGRRTDSNTLLGPGDGLRFGEACGLKASYNLAHDRWSVFCFLNSKAKEPYKLRGRGFGDPVWSYLDMRIVRCINISAAEAASESEYTGMLLSNAEGAFPWSGTCAPHGDINALVDSSRGLGVNLFFKLPSDPVWTESRWDRYAGPPEDNSMVNGWTDYVWKRLSSASCMNCRLYLKHTEALVNEPRTLGPLNNN